MKVVDKMNESIKAGKTFFSFEFFPPRTDEVIGKFHPGWPVFADRGSAMCCGV